MQILRIGDAGQTRLDVEVLQNVAEPRERVVGSVKHSACHIDALKFGRTFIKAPVLQRTRSEP